MAETDSIRRRNKDATRIALLDAARTVLAQDGFQAFGVNAIARAAGCDKQLIYRYFGGVDGLLEAIGEDIAGWIGDAASPTTAETYADWIAGMADHYLTALRANPLMQKVIAWELSAPPEKLAPLTAARSRAMIAWMKTSRGDLAAPAQAPAFNAIIIAAIHQLVLSGASAGAFSGLPLRSDEDWQRVRGVLRELIERIYK